jgi:hypothetical protein
VREETMSRKFEVGFCRANAVKAGLFLMVLSILLSTAVSIPWAADVGITIQTTKSSSYKGTQPLTKPILSQLKGTPENSDNPVAIGRALRQLRDGDILVLAVHSNPEVFGLGKETVNWSDFWQTFNISRPPRLASVIIGGCMSFDFKENGESRYVHVDEGQLQAIRSIFNAKTIFAPRGEIKPSIAIDDTKNLLIALFSGKKLADINLQKKWHYVADPRIDKNKVTLDYLRVDQDLQGCLCRCLEPKGGRFTCRYDLEDKGTSPSCGDVGNGPCICRAEAPSRGCFRRQPPKNGECRDSCVGQSGGN